MKHLIQIAEQLLDRKLTANDGYTSDEIEQAERMLGLTMPEALKLFYSAAGKVDVLVIRLYFLQKIKKYVFGLLLCRIVQSGLSIVMTRVG